MNKEQKVFQKVIKHRRKRESAKRRANQRVLEWKKKFKAERGKPKKAEIEDLKEKQKLIEEIEEVEPLPIVTDLDKLRVKSERVEKIDEEFLDRMAATFMRQPNAVGLSGVQVGRPEQYIVIWWEGDIWAFINPFITKEYWRESYLHEGCLSLPGKEVLVPSPEWIILDFTDHTGKRISNFKAKGVLARILRHEIDHTEGKLIIDYEEK